MENKAHAFAAGLFVLILGAFALLAVFWLGGIQDKTNDYVVVTKQNIGGLNPQAQVRYRGIRVGKVSDIRLDPEDYTNILITISVRDDVPLTHGTVAKLNYQGVTGLAHILLLETGKDKTPLLPNDEEPPHIQMLPSMLEELSEMGLASMRQVQLLVSNLNALLNDQNRQHLGRTLANMEAASGQVKPTVEQLNLSLRQIAKLLNEDNLASVQRTTQELGPLLADARRLLSSMQSTTEKLDGAIGEASGAGAAAVVPRLNEMATDISATSRQLGRLLRMLEESPQGLVFGTPELAPGPGEPGFAAKGGQ